MQKKFSVFISSPYKGMQDVRATVSTAVAEVKCIPEGMELFPVSTGNKWVMIRNAIRMSDFCIVILGGRYGTAVPEEFLKRADGAGFPGVGYTELECRYAEKRGIPVLPFLHTSPEEMLVGEAASGETDEKWGKLQAFRARLERGSPGYWESPLDLRENVKNALHQSMRIHSNRPGWVRGSHLEHAEGEAKRWKEKSERLEEKAERLEKENEELRKKSLPPFPMRTLPVGLEGAVKPDVERGIGLQSVDLDPLGPLGKPKK